MVIWESDYGAYLVGKLAFEPWKLKEHLAKTGSGGLYFSLFKKEKSFFLRDYKNYI